MTALSEATDIVGALFPEEFWNTNDDLCDCTYQRIGMWTNPYLAETLEVRMCCIWDKLYELFPGLVRVTPGFLNYNTNEWVTEPMEWNGETDMPRAIWYRQLARNEGISVADAREKYRDQQPPKGTPKPIVEPPETVDIAAVLFEMVQGLADQVAQLRGLVEARE